MKMITVILNSEYFFWKRRWFIRFRTKWYEYGQIKIGTSDDSKGF